MSTSSWTYVSEIIPCWDWSSRSEVLGFHFCKENRWKPGQSSTTSTGAIACRCVWPHKDDSQNWKGHGWRVCQGFDNGLKHEGSHPQLIWVRPKWFLFTPIDGVLQRESSEQHRLYKRFYCITTRFWGIQSNIQTKTRSFFIPISIGLSPSGWWWTFHCGLMTLRIEGPTPCLEVRSSKSLAIWTRRKPSL